jgi:ribulose kinase
VIAGPVEAAALGNALVQAVATGHIKDLAQGQDALRQSVELESYEPVPSGAHQAFEHYKSIVARGRNPQLAPTNA